MFDCLFTVFCIVDIDVYLKCWIQPEYDKHVCLYTGLETKLKCLAPVVAPSILPMLLFIHKIPAVLSFPTVEQ